MGRHEGKREDPETISGEDINFAPWIGIVQPRKGLVLSTEVTQWQHPPTLANPGEGAGLFIL
jgi:hypothetical protein